MSRLHPIHPENAEPKAAKILAAVQESLGLVPNMVATLAQSPAAASAYVSFSGALAQGTLPVQIRERIALAVAEKNKCAYCLAAHTFLGAHAGLSGDEIILARRGTSHDAKTAAALVFATRLNELRGQVTEADLTAVRQAGFTEGEIAEIIANVALNIFTNYFNIAADVEIDFPLAPQLAA